jgi:NAD(P)-dependent dehydrogenase (short-subunit alcohol dehydrogenase family)
MVGKVALVTGAASGIGKATARLLAAEGAATALTDVNQTEAEEVALAIRNAGGQALAAALDVCSESNWEAVVAKVLAEWGKLDVCVNCAGISFSKPLTETSLKDWRKVMATNLDGVFLGTRHTMEAMRPRGGGGILNISSAAGLKALPGNAAYGTSKAAIQFLTRIAAIEGLPCKIRVNSISPGAVATPMWTATDLWPKQVAENNGPEAALNALVVEKGFARPEDIASAILFLASEQASFVTGIDLPIDAGFSAS